MLTWRQFKCIFCLLARFTRLFLCSCLVL